MDQREIALDTETTGFSFDSGDRIVEIGCVEMENLMPTGRVLHLYINPERSMPQEAFNVHGLSSEFLSDKPVFDDIAKDFLDFIQNDPLVIHNAPFDMGFLNGEMGRSGRPLLENPVVDTLTMARRKFPKKQSSLDALCNLFKIDKSGRDLHGALIDASLLAEVYTELRGGRNYHLELEQAKAPMMSAQQRLEELLAYKGLDGLDESLIFKPTETEMRDNTAFRGKHGFM